MTDKKRQQVVSIIAFFLVPAILLGATLVSPMEPYSPAERRKLASFERLSWNGLMNQSFQDQADMVLQDHLALRQPLLRLRSLLHLGALAAMDDEDLISRDGILVQTGQTLNYESLEHAAEAFDRVWTTALHGTDCRVFLSIVPDKAYFLRDDPDVLAMDYDAFFNAAAALLPAAQQVDLSTHLDLKDYYASDPHWKQDSLTEPAQVLARAMNITIAYDWTLKDGPLFTGSQGAVSMLPRGRDHLDYLISSAMENWTVTRYDEKGSSVSEIYDFSKADSFDPYTFFLGGAAGMITIENPAGTPGRQLVVFGDSFSMPMSILLASGYEKTTLIDLRNIPSFRVKTLVDFRNQDVLFLYSMTILNDSSALR